MDNIQYRLLLNFFLKKTCIVKIVKTSAIPENIDFSEVLLLHLKYCVIKMHDDSDGSIASRESSKYRFVYIKKCI